MNKHELREKLYSILSNDFTPEEIIDIVIEYKQLTENEKVKIITVIASQVCNVEVDLMKSKSRKTEAVRARAFVFDYLKKNTSFSLKKIGGYFDRDHASVLHGLKLLRDDLETKFRSTPSQYEVFLKRTEKI